MLDRAQPDDLRSPVTLEFRILGPLEVSDETGHVALGGPKQRGLLAILVLEAGRVVATDRLIDLLWGAWRLSHQRADCRSGKGFKSRI